MDIFELHADTCKALASPARLRIIALLGDGEMSVGELAEALGARKAYVSQHLAVMRQKGIVQARREGLNIYYRLTSPKVVQACELMREVLQEQIATMGELLALREGGAVSEKGAAP
jgi:ArsR family transcriptional regulator